MMSSESKRYSIAARNPASLPKRQVIKHAPLDARMIATVVIAGGIHFTTLMLELCEMIGRLVILRMAWK